MAYDVAALKFAFTSGAVACQLSEHPHEQTEDWLEAKWLEWKQQYDNLQRALRGAGKGGPTDG